MCHGNGSDHCCYIGGQVCPELLVDSIEGRRFACGLLVRLGSWEAVYDSPAYQALPAAQYFREKSPGLWCGDWPQAFPEVMNKTTAGKCCYG